MSHVTHSSVTPAPTEIPLIEMIDAAVWRGTTRVFDRLSLRIEQGESLAIIGPNGSGKTTLAKLLSRELYPVRRPGSSLRLLGRERFSIWDYRRSVGIVSDDLFDHYPRSATVMDAVLSAYSLTAGIRRGDRPFASDERSRARQLLDEFGLQALATRRLDTLSTGQHRRTMLARALVHEPQTLIFDEPTAGLDLAAAFEFLATIRTLAAKRCSIVIVTHLINEIPPEVGRIVAISGGKIVHDGPKADVLTSGKLNALYQTPVTVTQAGDYFVALPG